MFMKHLIDVIQKDTYKDPVTIDVHEMSACGKAMVRHLVDWLLESF